MARDTHRSGRWLRRSGATGGEPGVTAAMSAAEASAAFGPAASGTRIGRPTPNDFDTLFDTHYERLVRSLTVVAGNRDVAADAVQDAFVRAHLRWNKIRRYDDPSGWVRRVAINRLRDEHRRSRRKQRALLRLGSQSTETSDVAEIDEFARLLSSLPRQQRLATALYYVNDLSIAEIADTLAVSTGTVKSHLHDARRRLRPILENEAHHD